MAKVKVGVGAFDVVSEVTLENIKKLAKYAPEKLTLYGGEDGKEELFKICAGEKHGCLSKYGAEFGVFTKGEEGFAAISIALDAPVADIANEIVDKYGAALANLNELEATLPEALAEVERKHSEVMACIEIG